MVIKFLEKIKLAKNVKVPRPELIERRKNVGRPAMAVATPSASTVTHEAAD
jgi:hypothetical protein